MPEVSVHVGGLGLRAAFNTLYCPAENYGVRYLIEFQCLPACLSRNFDEVSVFSVH